MPEQVKSTPRLKAVAMTSNPDLSIGVSEKGGISVYGLQRFPITLYFEQWETLLGDSPDGSVGAEIITFGTEHADLLSDGRPVKAEKGEAEKLMTLDAPYAAILDAEIAARQAANDFEGAVKYATIKAVAAQNGGKVPTSSLLEVYMLKARK